MKNKCRYLDVTTLFLNVIKFKSSIKWSSNYLQRENNLRALYTSLQQHLWVEQQDYNMDWSSKSSKFIIQVKIHLIFKVKPFHSYLLFLESLFSTYFIFIHLYTCKFECTLDKNIWWEFEYFSCESQTLSESLSILLCRKATYKFEWNLDKITCKFE